MKRKALKLRRWNQFTKKPGLYWHVHHDTLLEWCFNPRMRARYIQFHKHPWQEGTRLTRLHRVKTIPKFLTRKVDKIKKRFMHVSHYSIWRRVLHTLNPDQKRQLFRLHLKECPNCPFLHFTGFNKENRRVLSKKMSVKHFLAGDLFP